MDNSREIDLIERRFRNMKIISSRLNLLSGGAANSLQGLQ